uniref:Uncharacterized protein n=2 Tax=Cacopsylla melanoneura TaxID=428564 RepID=A0A8D8S878_9HEMI
MLIDCACFGERREVRFDVLGLLVMYRGPDMIQPSLVLISVGKDGPSFLWPTHRREKKNSDPMIMSIGLETWKFGSAKVMEVGIFSLEISIFSAGKFCVSLGRIMKSRDCSYAPSLE